MSTELATIAGNSELAIANDQSTWTPKQVSALKQLGVNGAAEGDLDVFFHQCTRTGLDPFARQIYMIGRKQWNQDTRQMEVKQTIQTGIDGFRLVARRATDRARGTFGYEDNLWCGSDGQWTDVWLSNEPPRAAKVTVTRDGSRYPAIATITEYAGTKKDGELTKMWAEKPALMLAKCAEALALRKAFPHDLSGVYTAEEMAQQDNPERSDGSNIPSVNGRRPQQATRVIEQATEPEAAPLPDIDVAALTEQAYNTDSIDTLRDIWKQTNGHPESVVGELISLIMARQSDIKKAEQAAEEEAAVATATDVLNAEVVDINHLTEAPAAEQPLNFGAEQ